VVSDDWNGVHVVAAVKVHDHANLNVYEDGGPQLLRGEFEHLGLDELRQAAHDERSSVRSQSAKLRER
jgi:hypothetical protein